MKTTTVFFSIALLALIALSACTTTDREDDGTTETPQGPSVKVSASCTSYFDGCNTCIITDGMVGACTKMYCETMEEPRCLEYAIPKDCTSWFDGCNTCGAENGELTMCTLMFCETPVEPKCLEFAQ